ncbi:hypothetical protein BCR32DRAFT_284125 [Anaeromyces robustus]|uniref:Uncharacterized protein n=1 Tax=Anaeromyces robustus TaxID=1754192 RepID=A0A1Y1WSW2_9FUNG|nr:hypothetical protein BCR32DRAFT_284125 [Anaeromyces robustus]|eukprot:ORX76485.1 hypothetical protein BCR32DRAFT_284125 [Anaeromyces robustus]
MESERFERPTFRSGGGRATVAPTLLACIFKKNNDNLANIEDFRRFALILCSLRSSAQELQHI